MRRALLALLLLGSTAVFAAEPEGRGHALAITGDCAPCHTKAGGTPFAGGRPIETPFGTLYSANITPDRDNGIGGWTPDQFYRALHEGVDDEGHHLYPAFPYNYFTKMPREDADALFAYLKTLQPAHETPPRNELKWPFSMRWLMIGWNMLFLDTDGYKPDPSQSAEWNRGAFLVDGPAHCGACHTPMNMFGAPKNSSEHLRGGRFAESFAPDLTTNKKTGIGSWSGDDIVAFLKTGRNAHANASVDMGEVVQYSTSLMSDDDLHAIATYLQTLSPSPDAAVDAPPKDQMKLGEAVFSDNCTACHQSKAEGVPTLFPPLEHSAEVQQRNATMLIHAILTGTQTASTDKAPTAVSMPAYHWKLSDEQVAAVTTYIRNAWGNSASSVSAKDVAELRKKLVKE